MAERGWPRFTDGIDERRQKAREGSSKEFSADWVEARPGQGGNGNGLRSPTRSAGPPEDGDISYMPHRAIDSAWAIAGRTAIFLVRCFPLLLSATLK
jgi:hypothetical protein